MAYRIKSSERPDAEIFRILATENRRAGALLRRWRDDPAEHIHELRQTLKRIRALLRLVRTGAQYVFYVENDFYRDLARPLSYARDQAALIEALDLLKTSMRTPRERESLRMMRLALQRRAAAELELRAGVLADQMASASVLLRAAVRRQQRAPLNGLSRADLRRAVETTFERCRKGYLRAKRSRAADDFHAWRKQVKYAHNQSRLMAELLPAKSAGLQPVLERLGCCLGDQHDLVVLDRLLHRQTDALGLDVHPQAVRRALRDLQIRLEGEALEMGTTLHGRTGAGARLSSGIHKTETFK